MGGGGSQPSLVVEVRLERPEAKCSTRGQFFARLHTAADGVSKYEAWGRPQALGLWTDDIITVSLCISKSEESFLMNYEDFAELYLPWEMIQPLVNKASQEETVFRLGICRDAVRLGQHASPLQYGEAFTQAVKLAEEDLSVDYIRIWIRRRDCFAGSDYTPMPAQLAHPSASGALSTMPVQTAVLAASMHAAPPHAQATLAAPVGSQQTPPVHRPSPSSPAGFSAIVEDSKLLHPVPGPALGEEPNPADVRLIEQLQVEQQRLRDQLAMRGCDQNLPNVESQVQEYIERLKQAEAENWDLLAKMQLVDMELAKTTANLSDDDQRLLTGQGQSLPSSVNRLGQADQAEYELIFAEIQNVTGQNVELIKSNEQEIQKLTAELLHTKAEQMKVPKTGPSAPGSEQVLWAKIKQHEADLKACMEECRRLELRIEEERCRAATNAQPDVAEINRLKAEISAQHQIIDGLEKQLQKEQAPIQPPRTADLQDEVEMLKNKIEQVQQIRQSKQVAGEQSSRDLRDETQQFEADRERTLAEKASIERQFEELKRELEEKRRLEQEQRELTEKRKDNQRKIARQNIGIKALDGKIQDLKNETSIIQQRAGNVLQAAPRTAQASLGSSSPTNPGHGAQKFHLSKTIMQLKQKVDMQQRLDKHVQREEEDALQELEDVRAEVARMEEQLQHVRGGRPP